MTPQTPAWQRFAKKRKGDFVRSKGIKGGGSRHRLTKTRRARLLADIYGRLFMCRDMSRWCPEEKKRGGAEAR